MKPLVLFLFFNLTISAFYTSQNNNEIPVYYGISEEIFKNLKNKFELYGLQLKPIDKLNKNNKKLHIILDAYNIPFEYFPENYLIYQTLDFDKIPLTKSYFEKLNHAIAVWDPSWKNISKYSLLLDNYFYFTPERIDPLILPFFIPHKTLDAYNKMVKYSNTNDTDISSHLPAIFVHTFLKNPKLMMEVGIRSGQSTRAFEAALNFTDSKLIGIDICSAPAQVYKNLTFANAEFYHLDDILFASWWKTNSPYKSINPDLIFIDTSHFYEHTVQELASFVPMLHERGMLMFHDTNMCPLINNSYQRLNNTMGTGWNNEKGVVRAIKEYFSIEFDETKYTQMNFSSNGSSWALLHYPYCNGLTLIKKID